MTRPEFLRGWLLLTAQPWGKAYRSDMTAGSGEPSPAKIQAELYYQAFASTTGEIWVKACMQQAAGEHWPSIDAIRQAIRNLTPTNPLLTNHASREWMTKGEFGLPLFEAISLCGGALFLREAVALAMKDEGPAEAKEYAGRLQKVEQSIREIFPKLSTPQQTELLAEYDWIGSL